MGLISKQKYDPAKIEKLLSYLRIYHEKRQPIDYEILIDGLKAVRRTNDPEMFSTFESFIDADSKGMEVLFYNGSSNVHEKRIFFFDDEEKKEKGLSGVEIEGLVQEGIDKNEKERQYRELQRENAELKRKVSELEKEIDELEKEKEAIEASQSPLKGFLGELGSSFVESFIRRNPKIINGIPGGEALAGLLEKQEVPNDQVTESEVNFKPKTETPSLSDEDQAAITFVHQLKHQFDKDEFNQVLIILQALADDKKKIDLVVRTLTH